MPIDAVQRAVNEALITIMRDRLAKDYCDVFSDLYDQYLVRPYRFNEDDKTSPIYIKSAVVEFVREGLQEAVEALDPNKPLVLEAIPDDVFTLPSRQETDKVRLFYFYLAGTPGKFVVLRSYDYEVIFPYLKGTDIRVGRFGNLHMLPYDKYLSMYTRVPSNFTKRWPHPDSIVHPFSGAPPVHLFEELNPLLSFLIESYMDELTIEITHA